MFNPLLCSILIMNAGEVSNQTEIAAGEEGEISGDEDEDIDPKDFPVGDDDDTGISEPGIILEYGSNKKSKFFLITINYGSKENKY